MLHKLKSLRGPFLDLLFLFLMGVWWSGGIPWHEKRLLPFGPDIRRAMIVIWIICAWQFPALARESRVCKGVQFLLDKLTLARGRWILFFLTMGYAMILGILQTLAIRYPMYDVGIFHQILWNIIHGNGFLSTISKAGNFLLDHFAPTLALLTPAFWISGSSPLTLAVVHVLLIFGGMASWIYLAERISLPASGSTLTDTSGQSRHSDHFAAAVTLITLSFNSLWANLRWGFHENAIYFCATSWALTLLTLASARKASQKWLIYFLMLVGALSKEILLVNVALAFFAWSFVSSRDRNSQKPFNLLLFLTGLALLGGFLYFEHLPHPADKNYFVRYYSYLGTDLKGFFNSLLFHPIQTLIGMQKAIGTLAILKYLGMIFTPFFIPALGWLMEKSKANPSPRGVPLILISIVLPSIASMGMSTFPDLRSPFFHYVLEIWPALMALAILWLARLPNHKWAYIAAVFSLLHMDQDPLRQLQNYARAARIQAGARNQMLSIDRDQSILSDDLAGPWVANRSKVARWPDMIFFQNCCPHWIIAQRQTDAEVQQLAKTCQGDAKLAWESGTWRGYQIQSETPSCR
jgi:hypothetical protein